MTLSELVVLFITYSVIGWICEVVYCSILEKRFINRGFLRGPVCPIYGFGALLVLLLLEPLAHTWIPLFLAAAVLTTLLEYFSSWLLEVLFSAKWWDYSHMRWNIHGRVCLLNTVLFGMMGMLASHFVHQPLVSVISRVPDTILASAAAVLAILFIADVILTVHGLVNFNEHLARFKEFTESLREKYEIEDWFPAHSPRALFDVIRERAKTGKTVFSAYILDRIENFTRRHGQIDRFIHVFPGITSRKYSGQLEEIKRRIREELDAKKQQLAERRRKKSLRRTDSRKQGDNRE